VLRFAGRRLSRARSTSEGRDEFLYSPKRSAKKETLGDVCRDLNWHEQTLESDNELSMSYESQMLEQLAMPIRKEVEQALLRALLKHGGVIKEFGSGEEIVDLQREKEADASSLKRRNVDPSGQF
jgi:hypothetical protein